jgi:hypothetical protein
MFAHVTNGEVINIINSPRSITIDGVTYPGKIFSAWSHEERAEIGILPYREERVDNRYYWTGNVTYNVSDTEVVGTFDEIARDIGPLIEGMISETRAHAASILGRDDWMVSREFEGGTVIPVDVKTFRSEIRAESNAKEAEISAITTLDGVMAFRARPYTSVTKVKHTSEEGVETWGPETNPPVTVHMDMVRHYVSVDPLAEVDPSFVSLEVV